MLHKLHQPETILKKYIGAENLFEDSNLVGRLFKPRPLGMRIKLLKKDGKSDFFDLFEYALCVGPTNSDIFLLKKKVYGKVISYGWNFTPLIVESVFVII